MNFADYCAIRYRSKMDEASLLKLYNEKTGSRALAIHPEFTFIVHNILNTTPCNYWNERVRQQTYYSLERLLNSASSRTLIINSEMMECFFVAHDTYQQVTEVIQDFSKFNSSASLKNRLYRIPTYISIVEGCLTNLYRVVAMILTQITDKDYQTQNKLSPLCEMLVANSMEALIQDIDVDIRNAINHGSTRFTDDGKQLHFKYSRGNTLFDKSLTCYEFDSLIDRVYDACSATLLGITGFLNEHMDRMNHSDIEANVYTSFKALTLRLSIDSIFCSDINDSSINHQQLNILINIQETDRTYILQTAIAIAAQVFEKYPNYEKYYVQFNHPRMLICFVRFTKEEIVEFLNDCTTINDNIQKAIARKDVLLSNPSTEIIDLQEIKYHLYPNFQNDEYSIRALEDASNKGRKRFRAQLFVGNVANRNDLIRIIREAVNWIKPIRNIAQPAVEAKHGDMDADSIYLNVFRFDTRQDKNMYPKNRNFTCFVDYNVDGKTSLENGGVFESLWYQYSHEVNGLMRIAWNDKQYYLGKIGRNDPCSCGSGKKYKTCCGKTL